MTGERPGQGTHSTARRADVFDLKGALEDVLTSIGFVGETAARVDMVSAKDTLGYFHPRASASILVDQRRVGVFGELHPDLASLYDLTDPIYGFEIDARQLAHLAPGIASFKPLPIYQSVRRDLALVVDSNQSTGAIVKTLASTEGLNDLVEDISIFDVYEGEGVSDHKKSVAIAVTLRSKDGTLKEEEINAAAKAMVDNAKEKLGATVR